MKSTHISIKVLTTLANINNTFVGYPMGTTARHKLPDKPLDISVDKTSGNNEILKAKTQPKHVDRYATPVSGVPLPENDLIEIQRYKDRIPNHMAEDNSENVETNAARKQNGL